MTGFIDAVTSPWPLLAALVAFGFAPGAVLRVIVLAFPRDDPRRRERLGELYSVPRFERPLWVFEQLDRALIEGLVIRYKQRQTAKREGGAVIGTQDDQTLSAHGRALTEDVTLQIDSRVSATDSTTVRIEPAVETDIAMRVRPRAGTTVRVGQAVETEMAMPVRAVGGRPSDQQ
jgi:hypothetical protein